MCVLSTRSALVGSILALSLATARCHADIVLGVDWHIEKADAVLVVQAQTGAEADAFPAPAGKVRLRVIEVLKGIMAEQFVLLPAKTVRPGGKAIVLIDGDGGLPYEPLINPEPWRKRTLCWPIEENGNVNTGQIPAKSHGGFALDRNGAKVTLPTIRAEVAASSPDETGLHGDVLDACLFPEKLAALERKNPRRARYVRLMAAMRDLDRDVPALAALLGSADVTLQTAAEKRLRQLTGASLEIKGTKDRDRHAFANAWREWWDAHRPSLSWDEKTAAWVKRADALPWPRRWPALPAPLKHPADTYPADLLQTLEKNDDSAAFARAYRRWLDSGVLRDRQLVAAAKPFMFTRGKLTCLPADLLLKENVKPAERMKAIERATLRWHRDRFAAERREAITFLKTAKPEVVGRAAFWELRATNVTSPGNVAVELLTSGDDDESQKIMMVRFLADTDGTLLHAACASIAKGRKVFSDALLRHARDHRDNAAGWACWAFCMEKKHEAVPVLIDWLNDPKADARSWAGHNLYFFPEADVVPALLAALAKEKDAKARSSMISALAHTGDKRGLEVLIAAAPREQEIGTQIGIAQGLATIRDKRALPALASMAERATDERVSMVVVNAFGHVSGLYKSPPYGTMIEPDRLKEGLRAIAKWRTQQKNP